MFSTNFYAFRTKRQLFMSFYKIILHFWIAERPKIYQRTQETSDGRIVRYLHIIEINETFSFGPRSNGKKAHLFVAVFFFLFCFKIDCEKMLSSLYSFSVVLIRIHDEKKKKWGKGGERESREKTKFNAAGKNKIKWVAMPLDSHAEKFTFYLDGELVWFG